MTIMLRILKYIIFLILIGGIIGFAWVSLTRVSSDDLPPLKTGDIVFQTTNTTQTLAILFASGSIYAHTGLVNVSADGSVTVIEAAEPVREVPLDEWIDQGVGGRITIKRLPELSDEQAKRVIESARTHKGKPYDFLFHFDRDTIYCSELVYYAFQDGAKLDLGEVDRISDLNVDNFAVQKIIEQRWQDHPVCQEQGATDYETCYDVIMSQTIITPAALAEDKRLELIFSNYSPF